MAPTTKIVKGDCDCCTESVNVVLYGPFNGMMMCEGCAGKQAKVVAAEKVVETSRATDAHVVSKQDIFTTVTTAFIELQGAVHANTEVKPEDKNYVMAELVTERIKRYDAAIFGMKDALASIETERFGWLKNLQPLVSTLRIDQQAKFSQNALNYKPVAPSTRVVKKAASGKSPKASEFKRSELSEAAKKYNLSTDIIRSIMVARNLNADDAAKYFVSLDK